MEPKLIPTELGSYQPAEWSGRNESGWSPLGSRVLVLPDQPADQTSGGIYIDESLKERMAYAAESGVLVAVGPGAFQWDFDGVHPFKGERPKPGDRVCFERYGGQIQKGRDGQTYRAMDDRCVAAVEQSEEVT